MNNLEDFTEEGTNKIKTISYSFGFIISFTIFVLYLIVLGKTGETKPFVELIITCAILISVAMLMQMVAFYFYYATKIHDAVTSINMLIIFTLFILLIINSVSVMNIPYDQLSDASFINRILSANVVLILIEIALLILYVYFYKSYL